MHTHQSQSSYTNLAQLIHKALVDPGFRLVLESGHLNLAGSRLSAIEVAAASEVMRCCSSSVIGSLFGSVGLGVLPNWREE